MEHVELYLEKLLNAFIAYIPNLFSALVTLIIGLLVIKYFKLFITSLMTRRNLEPTLLRFIMDLVTWILRIILFISIITQLGVPTTSFVAIVGAASLAIGLSLQGSLSNFAGGLLIIMFKPFRVGDYIEAQNVAGTIAGIQIFNTKMITSTNQVIYIPNGILSNGIIKNFTQNANRRADIVISVDYNNDLRKVKAVLQEIINQDEKILKNPAPNMEIKDLGENSVNIIVYIWSKRQDYSKMVSDFYENTKNSFESSGIETPQRDIIIRKEKE